MIGRTMPDLHHREAGTPGDPAVLLVHGYPESSYMWRHALPVLAAAGFHAIAPDLAGFGDSEAYPPGTWERHVEALERFRAQLGLAAVALVVHDWGGLIGLRWACDHAGAVWALAISSTGFFHDGKWRGPGEVLRTPEQGEQFVDGLDREGFAGLLGSVSSGIGPDAVDEYFKAFADETRRRGQLELYRSGDFEKLEPYRGRLGALGVPPALL
jgi:haloalkane dehalogenase